jgi:uncharacterized membrane protein
MRIKIPILKTITYRVLGTLTTYCIAYFASGSVQIGMAVGLTDLVIKPLLYLLHEIVWQKFDLKKD